MKEVFHEGKLIKYIAKVSKIHKIKSIYLLEKFMITCGYILLFPSPFHVSTRSRLTLAAAFRSNYVAACSTAFRSYTEENESCGHVAVPCPSKVKQRSRTADRLSF